MNKKFSVAAIAAMMACMSMAGCGMNNSGSRVVNLGPGMSVEVTGNQGTLTMDVVDGDSLGAINIPDPMVDNTVAASEEAEQLSVSESVAEKFNVKLADNQYIITAKEEEAVIVTAPEGYKFVTQYSQNTASLEKDDYSESFRIYDSTGSLTKEKLSEMDDVEDIGDGCYIQRQSVIKAYCFKDGASVAIVYNNTSDNNTDIEKVTSLIKSLVEEFKICK